MIDTDRIRRNVMSNQEAASVADEIDRLRANADSLFNQGVDHFNRAAALEATIRRVEAILGYPNERVLVADVLAAIGGIGNRD